MRVTSYDFGTDSGRSDFWRDLSALVERARFAAFPETRLNYMQLIRVKVHSASGAVELLTLDRFRLWWFDDISRVKKIELLDCIERW